MYRVRPEPKCLLLIVGAPLIYIYAGIIANDWLYLLAVGLMCAVWFAILLPWLQLSGVRAQLDCPKELSAGGAADIIVRLNRKESKLLQLLLPLRWLSVEVICSRRGLPDSTAEIISLSPACFEEEGGETLLRMETPPLRRGSYSIEYVQISTCFPLFLVTWKKLCLPSSEQATITVFPKFASMAGAFLQKLRGRASAMGLIASDAAALTKSTLVRGLREFRNGDSLRHIHWGSTAKTGKLLVKEFDAETLPAFDVYLDLGGDWAAEQFETAVSLCYSLIALGIRMDSSPDLIVEPADSKELSWLLADMPAMPAPTDRIAHVLARVQPIKAPRVAQSESVRGDRTTLAVSPSSDGTGVAVTALSVSIASASDARFNATAAACPEPPLLSLASFEEIGLL